ncbi:MAG: GreA/GreB family elongation factor [Opitutaceae bacterium]|nr:GreA/GreB family elongation factor [Opitutaceae bacterium]
MIDKTEIIRQICSAQEKELAIIENGARDSRDDAIHEESQPEDKYDTHHLEASYLAEGQSRLAIEMKEALTRLNSIEIKDLSSTDPISLGALVSLKSKGNLTHYFLSPAAGGLELSINGIEILIISPQSPIGQKMLGKTVNDEIEIENGPIPKKYLVSAVA